MQSELSPAAGETIGQRLKRLRLERGLSQRELAAPGVSYAYISRIEAGTRQPSVKALRRLATNLGVTADFLETGSQLGPDEERELRLADLELAVRLGDASSVEEPLIAMLDEALRSADATSVLRARASLAKRSRKSRSRGLPQLRLRESRITCQSGPLMGSATPPARHPLA